MNIKEFSEGFDLLVDSYRRIKKFDSQQSFDTVEFNEYEKSQFLTIAQQELVVNFYNGKNPYGDYFEGTEELRRYLDNLVKTKVYSIEDAVSGKKIAENSVLFELPSDLAFITLEQVNYNDEALSCSDNTFTATVYPVTQDEYDRVRTNPFRGPTKYRVLRLDSGDKKVELISKYKIDTYTIKYLSVPPPIVLEDLPNGLSVNGESNKKECILNSILHDTILRRAVSLALSSKSVGAKEE